MCSASQASGQTTQGSVQAPSGGVVDFLRREVVSLVLRRNQLEDQHVLGQPGKRSNNARIGAGTKRWCRRLLAAMGVGKENRKEVKALQDAVKILIGRARRDPDGTQSTEALKDRIVAMGVGKENRKEVKALQDAVKILIGRARRDPDGTLTCPSPDWVDGPGACWTVRAALPSADLVYHPVNQRCLPRRLRLANVPFTGLG